MNLSTQELIHFTKYENLVDIINTQGFIPRYNLEYTDLMNDIINRVSLIPIPMVCFCDIPLNLSFGHSARYGKSGIALTEKWKLEKKLNPVLYINKNSELANVYAELSIISEKFIPIINDYYKDIRIHETIPEIVDRLRYLSYYVKQLENKNEVEINHAGKIRRYEKRKFYDEREWRYIPFDVEYNDELFLARSEFETEEIFSEANKKMEKYKLTFNQNDIKYLIVENQYQKTELTSLITDIYGDNYIEILINK
ncbi:MAG: hypothetical protein JXB49_18645 [Bacteroidales bacterium]|nr:hypothetical protein [Bacteroidales bacterium]